ncbi:MAG: DUF2085 domain-containing protein [Anaerolineales bacterium]
MAIYPSYHGLVYLLTLGYNMITITLYGRKDCHLCDEAKKMLAEINDRYPHQLIEIDTDQNTDLKKQYGNDIPVIEIGPYTMRAPIQRPELEITLAAAIDRKQQLETLKDPTYIENLRRGAEWTLADRIALWISKHYLLMINSVVLLYLGIPFLAPVFMKINLPTPAIAIYRVYGIVCHQLAYRSFFLFGDQIAYPRQAAGVSYLKSYHEATGLSEDNSTESIFAARSYIGAPHIGYKIALCQRDIAIYSGILLFGLIYALFNRKLPSLPWYLWIIFGLIPIGMDGVSQLISQPPFSLLPYRESTPILRVLTGSMFGFTTAWFGFPSVEESMAETRRILGAKQLRIATLLNQLKSRSNEASLQ